MDRIYHFHHRTLVFIVSLCLLLSFTFEHSAIAQASDTGSQPDTAAESPQRFELGVGGGGLLMNSTPEWVSDYYYQAFVSLSYRLFAGLSIEGGKDISFGGDIESTWTNASEHQQALTNKGTTKYGSWLGARYEFSLPGTSKNLLSTDAVLLSGGVTWNNFHIRSDNHKYYDEANGWETDSQQYEEYNTLREFSVADLTGYYVSVAGRWRMDTRKSLFSALQVGHYGIDAGFRYTMFNDHSLSHVSLEEPADMSSLQVFAKMYLKIGFFE